MKSLGPRDLGRALLGHEETLRAFAASPGTFRLGLLFVLSAGLAREYDGVYLLPEFWHALLPLAASLVTGTLFWLLFFWPWRGGAPSWKSFQGVFWLSAPLAWLYAIPYERFLAPLDAFYANVATLGFVSLWRVLWITRVLAVWRRLSFVKSLLGVLFLADLVVLVVGYVSPRPLVEFMGGVRGSELEQAIGTINTAFVCWSVLALPILGLLALFRGGFEPNERPIAGEPSATGSLTRLAYLALAALAVGALFVQGEQANRWRVERDLVNDRIDAALERMSARTPADFPPGWDPPPHRHLREDEPNASDVLSHLLEEDHAPWVLECFLPKLFHVWSDDGWWASATLGSELEWRATQRSETEARRLLELLFEHRGILESDQRQAVEALREKVLAGASLLPEPEGDATALPGD